MTLVARAFHDRYGYDEQDPYADSFSYQETDPDELGYRFILLADSKDTGGEVRLTYGRGTHFLTLGGEFRYRSVDSTSFNEFFDGRPAPDPPVDRQPTGRFGVLYGQGEWRPLDAALAGLGRQLGDHRPGRQQGPAEAGGDLQAFSAAFDQGALGPGLPAAVHLRGGLGRLRPADRQPRPGRRGDRVSRNLADLEPDPARLDPGLRLSQRAQRPDHGCPHRVGRRHPGRGRRPQR